MFCVAFPCTLNVNTGGAVVEVNGYCIEEDAAADDGSSSFYKPRDSEVDTTFFGIGGCGISETCASG